MSAAAGRPSTSKPLTTLRSLRSSAASDALSTTSGLRDSLPSASTSRIKASLAPSETKVRRFKKASAEASSNGVKKDDPKVSSLRNFGAAPKRQLNIIDVNVTNSYGVRRSWAQRAEDAIKNEGKVHL